MRVLHVMASGERGGGADHLLGVLPELSARGVECTAAVGENGPLASELRESGVPVMGIDLRGTRWHPRALIEIRRAVRGAAPDLVHMHGTRAGFFGALARGPRGRPSVYTAHGLSFRKETGLLRQAVFTGAEAIACRGATRVVSVSRLDLEELEVRRLVTRGRGHHIPNAVDHMRFTGERSDARVRLGLDDDRFVVGTVARLVAQKAVEDLIEAVARCGAEVRLVVVGDGARRHGLARLAARRGVRVDFAGQRDDVPLLLPAFDLFVLSSRWEGEPVALIEAMAAGLPCVATATPGAREVLEGVGELVGIGRPAELSAAIERLRLDPATRARLGVAGRQAVAHRSFAAVAAQLIDVYHACSAA